MQHSIDHNELNDALKRAGSSWQAGQVHGLLCGRLTVAGADGIGSWMDQVLAETSGDDALAGECRDMLDALSAETRRQLVERQSEFALLLPDDSDPATERTEAMAHWCEGFLHGLIADKHDEALKDRLAAEPLADIIRDMLQITRAAAGNDDSEGEEAAYAELVEYLRVATQLAYEELADLRRPAATAMHAESDTLH